MSGMRKLVYYIAVTLDGFIAGSDGTDPTGTVFTVGEDDIRFIVENYPETIPGPARAAFGIEGPGRRFDTVLEGRRSYEVGLKAGIDDAYPHLRHLVFSSTLESLPTGDIELVRGDALERARELKAEDGLDLWLAGGGRLASELLPEIDQLVLKVSPVVIGRGVPLFDGASGLQRFTPMDETALASGVRVSRYARAAAE